MKSWSVLPASFCATSVTRTGPAVFGDDLGACDDCPCVADFNCDGTVNSTDVSDFINQWFADQVKGTLITDWDGNGVVNSTDVSAFINDWFEDTAVGCGQ